MPVIVTYVVLVLGAVGALIHSLLTDPSSDAVFGPKVKAALGLAGIVISALLPAIQQAAKTMKSDSAPKPPSPPPLPVLFLFAMGAVFVCAGCAWFQSNKPALVPVEAAICVFGAEEAGLSPEQSSVLCKIAVDEVNSLLAQKHQKAGSFRHAGDAGADAR